MTKLSLNEFEKLLIESFRSERLLNPDLSHREFADRMKMSTTTLTKIVNGRRRLGFRLAKEICVYFEVEVYNEDRSRKPRAKSPRASLEIVNGPQTVVTIKLPTSLACDFREKLKELCEQFRIQETIL